MAIYNYGMPVNYPMPYQQQYPMQQTVSNTPITTNQSSGSGIIWVQGEAGAKAYPVAPGNSVLLMDSESECFYIKSTDASGVPMPLRSFTYTEVVQTQPQEEPKMDTSQYVTRSDNERRIEMNKLFQETQSNNMMNRIQQIIKKYNVPQEMQSNPQQIVNYLVQSGKVNQDMLNRAMQQAQKMGFKF